MSSRKTIDAGQARRMGARIKELRGTSSQADFAAALGIDRASLANYEAGRRIPNDVILKRLTALTKVTASELLFGTQHVPFADKVKRLNKQIEIEMSKRPGVVPRFMISDDELSLIVVYRMAAWGGDALEPLRVLVECAEGIIETEKTTADKPYGEDHVRRVREALRHGELEEGFDPEAALHAITKEGAP